MKKNFAFQSALIVAAGMMLLASCGENEVINPLNEQGQELTQGKAVVKLVFSSTPSVSCEPMAARHQVNAHTGTRGLTRASLVATRASLVANDKQLTDLYILDYDKTSGKLLQVLHQTSEAEDFAEPTLALTYGEHTIKVIATRSEGSGLLDDGGSLWSVQDNTAFSFADDGGVGDDDGDVSYTNNLTSVPVAWTSAKTSDSFGASVDATVKAGKGETINIKLERMVAKLVVNNTETYPTDCNALLLSLDEYKQWGWQDFDVIDAVKNQRTSDLSRYAGTIGKGITYFFLTPKDGYQTDITLQMSRKATDTPYPAVTVPGVKLQRNHITTITGSLSNHQSALAISVDDGWSDEENEVEF